MEQLAGPARSERSGTEAPPEAVCQGTLLSREQYLIDIDRWGYADARLEPRGPMSPRRTSPTGRRPSARRREEFPGSLRFPGTPSCR